MYCLSKQNNAINQPTRKFEHSFGLNAVSTERLDSGTSSNVTGAKAAETRDSNEVVIGWFLGLTSDQFSR